MMIVAEPSRPNVLNLDDVDPEQIALVGGKGAHLAELARIEGIRVPSGFCVTTYAFRRVLAAAPSSLDDLLEALSRLKPEDREAIRTLSAEARRIVEAVVMPPELAAAIAQTLVRLGDNAAAYAVRSSATAEDLPGASFAGQQDTYLNVVGEAAILEHVGRCWASLFTERAVTYRLRNGFDHRQVQMAVVVQRMVFPEVAGILFTADPVTSNRKVASVEASFGLGEALVSGRVNADVYKVRGGDVVEKLIGNKELAIHARPEGGTREEPIELTRQKQPALTDAQVGRLVELGRRIEMHFGCPQDIEWCLADDEFHFVQSRPITTLFPIPSVDDGDFHVYLSVGHQQMMTDAIKPLGISVWQLTAGRPMYEAGARLFVDVTQALASPASRAGFVEMFGRSDPLIGDALQTVLDRRDLLPSPALEGGPGGPPAGGAPAPLETDPKIVADLIARSESSLAALESDIQTKSGPGLFDFILAHLQEMKQMSFDPLSIQVVMAGMAATWWLNENLEEWLGEKSAADVLAQSVPHNVTSEMGLALLEVADAIRPHPEVVTLLQHVDDDSFLEEMTQVEGGQQAHDAIQTWLARYGMRGVGEIDITRPRFRERLTTLAPILLGHLKSFEPGEGKRRFEHGREQASKKEREILERLRSLPDGQEKADETKRMIDRVRTFIGYREYPKYALISRYFVYKRALLREAERLVQQGVLAAAEDIFYLNFHELHDVVRTNQVDDELIRERKDAFESYRALTPPRVLTSDGECIAGRYRREDLPAGALVGLAVSAGTIEGRARVILDMAQADLEAGDILVTAFTDPSWTPLFVAIKGLVTEVGGLMTHGAVIAREYGLPAVVGVEHATRLIRDGQRIRVHGTEGYVEILP